MLSLGVVYGVNRMLFQSAFGVGVGVGHRGVGHRGVGVVILVRLSHAGLSGAVLPEELTPSPLIPFNEALQHFQTTDLADFLVCV